MTVGLGALKDLLCRDTAMAGCLALGRELRVEAFTVNSSLAK